MLKMQLRIRIQVQNRNSSIGDITQLFTESGSPKNENPTPESLHLYSGRMQHIGDNGICVRFECLGGQPADALPGNPASCGTIFKLFLELGRFLGPGLTTCLFCDSFEGYVIFPFLRKLWSETHAT